MSHMPFTQLLQLLFYIPTIQSNPGKEVQFYRVIYQPSSSALSSHRCPLLGPRCNLRSYIAFNCFISLVLSLGTVSQPFFAFHDLDAFDVQWLDLRQDVFLWVHVIMSHDWNEIMHFFGQSISEVMYPSYCNI